MCLCNKLQYLLLAFSDMTIYTKATHCIYGFLHCGIWKNRLELNKHLANEKKTKKVSDLTYWLKLASFYLATDLFWYPLKTSENLQLSDFFTGYQKRSVTWKWVSNDWSSSLSHQPIMIASYCQNFILVASIRFSDTFSEIYYILHFCFVIAFYFELPLEFSRRTVRVMFVRKEKQSRLHEKGFLQ